MIKVGIIGATGYAGIELVKLLINHPDCEIKWLTAKLDKDKVQLEEEFPFLKPYGSFTCWNFSEDRISPVDIVFLAVPHTVSVKLVPLMLNKGTRVIDLSADFRLKDPTEYKQWYGIEHPCRQLLKKAVYGLPELYSKQIKKTSLVANPGCFPTSVILGLAPVMKNGLVKNVPIFIDSKTGSSGAGRKPALNLIFPECVNNVRPYKVMTHQHQPEMEQELSFLRKKPVKMVFVPHLIPSDRGILSTIYIQLQKSMKKEELICLYKKFYRNTPFVVVLEDSYPEIKDVLHTNYCYTGIECDGKNAVIITAIDNLLKGAAGQAVQNMNIMFNLPEESGLR